MNQPTNPTARLAEPMTAETMNRHYPVELLKWMDATKSPGVMLTRGDMLSLIATIDALAAARAEVDGLRAQVIAGVYDTLAVGMSIVKTELLDEYQRRASSAERERDALRAFAGKMHDILRYKSIQPRMNPGVQDALEQECAALLASAAPPVECEGCKDRMELVQRWRSMAYPHRHDCDCPLCVDTKAMLAAVLAASTKAGREG